MDFKMLKSLKMFCVATGTETTSTTEETDTETLILTTGTIVIGTTDTGTIGR